MVLYDTCVCTLEDLSCYMLLTVIMFQQKCFYIYYILSCIDCSCPTCVLYYLLQPEYLNLKPSERELRNYVVKKALSKWQEVSTYLDITHEQVKAADANNPRNVQQAFFESLMHWHSGGTSKPVNWKSVLEALNDSELTEVAKNIQTELGKSIELAFLRY